jgi:hypothetical protein
MGHQYAYHSGEALLYMQRLKIQAFRIRDTYLILKGRYVLNYIIHLYSLDRSLYFFLLLRPRLGEIHTITVLGEDFYNLIVSNRLEWYYKNA